MAFMATYSVDPDDMQCLVESHLGQNCLCMSNFVTVDIIIMGEIS